MNSWNGIKQYKKIFLLFLFTLFLSSFIAPIIKVFLDTFVVSSPFIRELLNYKQGSYEFGKVLRRIMMAVAILLIFFLRKPLMISSFMILGIKPIQGWREQLQMGFLLGMGMFIFYVAILWAIGIQIFHPDTKSFTDIIFRLLTLFLIAGLVGCIEELLFRGFIFQSLLMDMRAVSAICISSLFYSLLHFFKAKLLVSPGFQPFIGFIVIYQSFKDIVINFTSILPAIIGLFLVGVVLSYAYFRTKSLYLAIGIHAGWIFLIKANKLFFNHAGMNLKWLFGDSKLITGLLGWSFLIFTLVLIHLVTKISYDGKNAARTF
jgi:membrane protease YdiL (CAAX protease family)